MRTTRRYLVGLAVMAAVGIIGAQGAQGEPLAMCAGKSFCAPSN
ncbi:hypothetical protein N798_12915 [Knoellia flava TL1]|jgi:hypothetical protein|uniref:Uncharacterized protein n=2 Tax=Knoellia flava TaxID=913969 RepID=A0A8H9FQ86_9MICO|nr:hypothetical protein [Knoellia flava]KGN29685.1 hypothetical protein N798_12915 [Knoellia flava TL1]MDT0215093.1 hypothetical protein [Rothia sp. ARF10]GGB66276.1 hypothetical protein GCM10011314_01820 [Knoellia flava]